MKAYRQRTITNRVKDVRVATSSALGSPSALTALVKKKYDAAALNAGKALADAADAKIVAAGALAGKQTMATLAVRDNSKIVRADCVEFSKHCRTIFEDEPGVLKLLGLQGPLPRARGDFLSTAKTMFDTGHYTAAMRQALADHEWTDARLSEARGKIGDLEFALTAQAQCKTNYQQATEQQRAALKKMDKWMGRFLKIARLVFANDPQQLEQLGSVARSVPTKKQREGRRKAAETRRSKKQQPSLPLRSVA